MPNHTGIPFAARSVVKSAGISTFETSQSQKLSAVDSHAKPKSRASSKCMRKWATAYLRTLRYINFRHGHTRGEAKVKS